MPKFDLAGNPLPETKVGSGTDPGAPLLPTPLHSSPAYRPLPNPISAPAAAQPSSHAMLVRDVVEETPASRLRAYTGLIITLLAMTVLTYAVAAIPSPTIPAPSGYSSTTFSDQDITCDVPNGWAQQDDAGDIAITDGSAEIHVLSRPIGPSGSYAPIQVLHQQAATDLSSQFPDSGCDEQSPQWLQTSMGLAMVSEWTAFPTLSSIRGYRATLLENGNGVEVICDCKQRDWATLQPFFLHFLASITSIPNTGQPANGGEGQ